MNNRPGAKRAENKRAASQSIDTGDHTAVRGRSSAPAKPRRPKSPPIVPPEASVRRAARLANADRMPSSAALSDLDALYDAVTSLPVSDTQEVVVRCRDTAWAL